MLFSNRVCATIFSMKNLLFIYNPKAGKGSIGTHLGDIVEIFAESGYRVTIYPTKCQGDGEVVAKQWAGEFDRVVCAGGDGTLDEIVTGVLLAGSALL